MTHFNGPKIAMISDGQGFDKPQGVSVKGMRGRGKDTDIETLQKPLPLTRGTEVWEFGFYKNYYITSAEYAKYEYCSVFYESSNIYFPLQKTY